nr:HNH endonuclease signature motif containing protein [Streptomyces caniscabiei]
MAAAVDAVFRRFHTQFVELPETWKKIPGSSRNDLKSKSRTAKLKRLANRDGSRCAYCGCEFYDLSEATLDHVVPYRLIRSWADWALVLSCGTCNNAKDNKIPAVLMPLLATLLCQLARMHAVPVERSLVPVGGAA